MRTVKLTKGMAGHFRAHAGWVGFVTAIVGLAVFPGARAGQVSSVRLCTDPGCEQADAQIQFVNSTKNFGFSTAMGNLNGDNLSDLVIGSPDKAEVYIFYGRVAPLGGNGPKVDPGSADVILDLSSALKGSVRLGFSVAVGNTTGTNNSLIIGAPDGGKKKKLAKCTKHGTCRPGQAFVVPASSLVGLNPNPPAHVDTLPGVTTIIGEAPFQEFGYAVGIGDVEGDGTSEFAVSAKRWSGPLPSEANAGRVYVLPDPGPGTTVSFAKSLPPNVNIFEGTVADEQLGERLVLSDLLPAIGLELAAGAVGPGSGAGHVYVFDGASPGSGHCLEGTGAGDFFGFSLASGDYDNDGSRDLAVGSIYEDGGGIVNRGSVRVFKTADIGSQTVCAGPTTSSLAIRGKAKWDEFGFDVASGDINGDDVDDLVASALLGDYVDNTNLRVDTGVVYLFPGGSNFYSPASPVTLDCPSANACSCVGSASGASAVICGDKPAGGQGDEAGFSLAVGDFNQASKFDDIALSSAIRGRSYLVSLHNQNETASFPGQTTDGERDLLDADDDGDGYADVLEDCDADGVVDSDEPDPLVPNPDLEITIDGSANITSMCGVTVPSIDVHVKNAGTTLQIIDPELRITLPTGAVYSYHSGSTSVNSNPIPDLGGLFPFTSNNAVIGTILPQGESIVRFDLDTAANFGTQMGMPLTANATVLPDELDPLSCLAGKANSTSKDIDLLCPDLELAKTCDDPQPIAGTTTTYTLTVDNDSAGNATLDASSIVVADTLPAAVTYQSDTGVSQGFVCSVASGVLTCTRSSGLVVGASTILTVTVLVNPSIPSGTVITNTADVLGDGTNQEKFLGNNTDSCTHSVLTRADLQPTMTDSPDPVLAGNNLTYSSTVHNNGPSDAATVTLTDPLPSGVTFVSGSGAGWTCSQAAGTVTCNTTGPLAANATSQPVSIVVAVDPALRIPPSPVLQNTISVSSTTVDPVLTNNSSSVTTAVNAEANLQLVKTDGPDPVNAGGTLTYSLAVNNAGPSTATSLTVSDTLPPGVAFVSAAGTGWTCSQAAGVVTCTRPALAVGAAPVVTISVTAPPSGPLSNTASVSATETDPVPGNNSDTEPTAVTLVADLSIAKTDSPDPVNAAGTLTYTLAVSNAGPSTATALVVTDPLPATVTFLNASGTGWSCSQAAGIVTCNRATLTVGAAPAITINVTAPPGGALSNTASVSAAELDPNAANNSDTEATGLTLLADVSLVKTDGPDPVGAGGTLTYTLAVGNAGPSAASGLTVTDTLPTGAVFGGASGAGWACSQAAGTVTCTRATLVVGPAPNITITVTAPASGPLSNTAIVSASEGDPAPGNNSDTEGTIVTPLADLSLAKTDGPDPVDAGGTLTYTLAVGNAGPSTASGLTVTDTLPTGAVFGGASGAGWACSQAAGTVTCTRAMLVVGPAPNITITVTAPAGGPLSNTAIVSASEGDPAPGNNSDTEGTAVTPIADLEITKSDSADPVTTGASYTYTLTATNLGPSDASNVTVTDPLPAGVSFVSGAGGGWSCTETAGTVTCTRAALASGVSAPITINVTAPSTVGLISNTADVSADEKDNNLANNSATETTDVQ